MTSQCSSSEEKSRAMDAQRDEIDSCNQRGTEHAEVAHVLEGITERMASTSPHPLVPPDSPAPVPLPLCSRITRHGEREDVAVRAARVKAVCRIEEVVKSYGVALTPVGGGRRLMALCPFHSEEHASFTVYPDTQSFCCYGCHAVGDVIAFVCLITGVGFDEALRLLGESREPARVSRMAHQVPEPLQHGTSSADRSETTRVQGRPLLSLAPRMAQVAQPASPTSQQQGLHEVIREPSIDSDGQGERPGSDDIARLVVLSATTVLAMQGLAHAPLALTYLGERGISYSLARRCRLGYLEEGLLAEYLAGDEGLERTALQIGLLNRLRRGTLTKRLIVPEVREGCTTQLIGRVLPGARTPLPHVKYYLVCGSHEKQLLGYGAALERLAQRARDAKQPGSRRQNGQELLGILVLEGALDYVIAVGWELPVLPVALLAAYPSRAQLAELLNLHARAEGLPLLLLLDADGPGREGTAYVTRTLRERQVPFHSLPPLSRLPPPSVTYKDLGELGPLGPAGRAHLLAAIHGSGGVP